MTILLFVYVLACLSLIAEAVVLSWINTYTNQYRRSIQSVHICMPFSSICPYIASPLAFPLLSNLIPSLHPYPCPNKTPPHRQIGPQVKWPLSVWPNLRFESVRTLLHGHEVPCQVPSSANFIHPNYLEFRSTPYPNCKNLMGVQNATCFRLTIHNLQEFEYHSSLPPPAFRRNG